MGTGRWADSPQHDPNAPRGREQHGWRPRATDLAPWRPVLPPQIASPTYTKVARRRRV